MTSSPLPPPVTASPAASLFRRVLFSPADIEALIPFCQAHGPIHDAPLLRRLTLDLTSDRAGVFVIADDQGPVLAATLIDRAENAADAAMLEILGVARPLPAAVFSSLVLAPAINQARASDRRSLRVELYDCCARIADGQCLATLSAAGFLPCYESFSMRRRADAPDHPAPAAPLPPGWRWAALDSSRLAAAHAALKEAFAGAPSFALSPLPVFVRTMATGASLWRVLLDDQGEDGSIAGLVQVVEHATLAEIRTVARAPSYRGHGLGQRLVAEGLRVLLAPGPRDVELTVEANNEEALTLYRRFGFEVVAQTRAVALDLR